MKVIIQIPCFDEESTLPATVAALPTTLPGVDVVEWLVVDDGSSDRTAQVARELGVHHVVRHTRNRGLAAAFLTGLDAALRAGADIVVNTDADNQYDAAAIPSLVAPILERRADVVVGERPIESIETFSRMKKRLQRLGSWVVRRAAGVPVRDATSGFRAFSRDAAMRTQVFGRYSYTIETLVQARAEGFAVATVPVAVNPPTRPSRLMRSTAQYVLRSTTTIVRSFVLYRPFRFFVLVGAVPAAASLVLAVRWIVLWQTDDTYTSRVPSLIAATVFAFMALQAWALAFLGDLHAAARRVEMENRALLRRVELDRR